MPDISIQFYASPSELLSFATKAAERFELYTVAMRFFPFEAKQLDFHEIATVCAEDEPFQRIAFTLEKPILPVSDGFDFSTKNPSSLRIDIGKIYEGGLEESWLSARTDDRGVFTIWSTIARDLKKITKSGAMGINRNTGARAFYAATRYTQGAKILEENGVEMWPPQGPKGPRIELGEKKDE